jgi:hypothetical protein
MFGKKKIVFNSDKGKGRTGERKKGIIVHKDG